MRYLCTIILFVISVPMLIGCVATKQDVLNMRLELQGMRREVEQLRRVNADLRLDIGDELLGLAEFRIKALFNALKGKIDPGQCLAYFVMEFLGDPLPFRFLRIEQFCCQSF